METATKQESLVGKILVDVWGYSMTIVNFYQIVGESKAQVKVKELVSSEKGTGYLEGISMPTNEFANEQIFKVKI